MNGPKSFNSRSRTLGTFKGEIGDIKNEPMFFNCDLQFAHDNGGPITRSFIESLPIDWLQGREVFDSRCHMLMPGWYPAIPGYHHDDVPRPPIPPGVHFATAGQPDYDTPRYFAEHVMGLVNAEICPTKFAIGQCTMPEVPDGDIIYRSWHKEVMDLIGRGELVVEEAKSNTLIYFDADTFHTADKAISNGWRWFGRVSRNTDRVNQITNEIRRQTQVYLEFPMQGW